MLRTTLKFVAAFVGVHIILGLALVATEVIHGVNDMDASFVLWLLVYYGNLPSVWLLDALHISRQADSILPIAVPILLMGIFQWAVVGLVVGVVWHLLRLTVFRKSTVIPRVAPQGTRGTEQ